MTEPEGHVYEEQDHHGNERELFSSWLSSGGRRERNAWRKLRPVWEPRLLPLLFATVLFGCRRPLVLLICERGIILHGTFPSSKKLKPFACIVEVPPGGACCSPRMEEEAAKTGSAWLNEFICASEALVSRTHVRLAS